MKNKLATRAQVSEALQKLILNLHPDQKQSLKMLGDVSLVIDGGFKFQVELKDADGQVLSVPVSVGDPVIVEAEDWEKI